MAGDTKPEAAPQRQLQIQVDDDVGQGLYANLVMINHTETEFLLDFVFVQPAAGRAKVRSRVLLPPRQAKRLVAALTENVAAYEARFGPVAAHVQTGRQGGGTGGDMN
jgi:hypothetical protein